MNVALERLNMDVGEWLASRAEAVLYDDIANDFGAQTLRDLVNVVESVEDFEVFIEDEQRCTCLMTSASYIHASD